MALCLLKNLVVIIIMHAGIIFFNKLFEGCFFFIRIKKLKLEINMHRKCGSLVPDSKATVS